MNDTTLACLAVLEDEACKLYEVLVDKSERAEVSLLFDEILQETRTHRELLRHMSKILGQATPPLSECEKSMGSFFSHSVEFIRSIKDQVLKGMPVVDAATKLVKFEEDAASEEDVTLTYVKPQAAGTTNTAIKRILTDIANDEKSHAEILRLIVEIDGQ